MTRRRLARWLVLTSALAVVVPTLGPAAPDAAWAQSGDDGFVPVTDAMLDDPAPADWLSQCMAVAVKPKLTEPGSISGS
ncbi:MAG TPA: hypothetical protein EYQ83_18130 [Acidobacteria bacterium]|nr:hypothetical protein [Acidobacteriota bacterium]